MTRLLRICVAASAALALTACGILFPSARERAGKETPGFKAGYSDGCASATVQDTNYRTDTIRDDSAYQTDKHYRAGWNSGFHNCSTNITHNPAIPGSGPIPDNLPGAPRH